MDFIFKLLISTVAIIGFTLYFLVACYVLFLAVKNLILAILDGRERVQTFQEVPLMVKTNPLNVIFYSKYLTSEGIKARGKGVKFIAIFAIMVAVPAIGDSIIRNLLR